jgi:hypothetical protein
MDGALTTSMSPTMTTRPDGSTRTASLDALMPRLRHGAPVLARSPAQRRRCPTWARATPPPCPANIEVKQRS